MSNRTFCRCMKIFGQNGLKIRKITVVRPIVSAPCIIPILGGDSTGELDLDQKLDRASLELGGRKVQRAGGQRRDEGGDSTTVAPRTARPDATSTLRTRRRPRKRRQLGLAPSLARTRPLSPRRAQFARLEHDRWRTTVKN